MKATFWGVRGSFPVAHPKVLGVGGNTCCVSLEAPGAPLVVIDAGTGLRLLGRHLQQEGHPLARGCGEGIVLVSHTHWDHIQGFLFFAPFYEPGNRFVLCARSEHHARLEETFARQGDRAYSELDLPSCRAGIEWRPTREGERFSLPPWEIRTERLNHPGIALGYRIEREGATLVYLCDTAPFDDQLLGEGFHNREPETETGRLAELERLREATVSFVAGADALIYDCFFTEEMYTRNPHWGHSTTERGAELCRDAGVPLLFLFHHHPEAWDELLEERLEACQRAYAGSALDLVIAREGESHQIG